MKNKTLSPFGFILCFILLIVPSFNIIDPLPDFIAYFLFALVLTKPAEIVPYLDEARTSASKLGLVTLMRIPASAVMLMNMYSGRDIVTLFTFVFAVVEAILLYSLITNFFLGLFYLAERCNLPSITSPVSIFGKSVSPDSLKSITLIFALTKCALNAIPEFCLLTTENPTLKRFFTEGYPVILITALLFSLMFGICWLVLAYRYLRGIYNAGGITEAIDALAGEEKLEFIANKNRISGFTKSLTLLSIATLFSFDIVLDSTGGVNLLPHFIFGSLLIFAGIRLFESRRIKIALAVSELLYTVFGLLAHFYTVSYFDKFTMLELLDREPAQRAYLPIKIFSLLEAVSFIALIALMAIGFRTFLRSHTGVSPKSNVYNETERQYHRKMSLRSYLLFGIAGFIQLLKCLKVFLDASINLIFTQTDVIVTSPLPWLGWVTVGISVFLIGYSFYYLSDVKGDVKFKYDKEERDTKRGIYE